MDQIAKKYRVLKTLGEGAMGAVYLVLPPRGDPVALKLLKTGEGAQHNKAAIEQFENEFKVLKKLSHPHIGRIHDYGYDEEQKKVYFTSPWLKGSDMYASTKDVPFEKCEEYLVQLLRALNYLHQKNIIHCDLKPGNVFVENEQVLLIDFGLAGYWGESIVGTPTYLAPEIFRGEHHNVKSDLYAVGVIMYNCLARTQPYSGKTLQEVYDRHRTHTPPPISELNPKVPRYLSDIALTLLSKKPEERYVSAAAVIDEIAAYSAIKYTVETTETLLSYLPKTSELIGRKEVQWRAEKQVGLFLQEKPKKPYIGLFIHGEHGSGKSKFINQIKTRLQLEKIVVEDAHLPLSESDRKVLQSAKAIILDDVEDYLDPTEMEEKDDERQKHLQEFISFLEQKILSPDTTRLLFVVAGTHKDHWKPFEKLFPQEEFLFESVVIPPFDKEETRTFLETIIGQSKIPENFVSEVFRNTGGSPAICQQIIENLIQQGLLFDQSGRWSADLLTNLEDILSKVKTPRSLEEKLRKEYASLAPEQCNLAHWLALSPQGLSKKTIGKLMNRWWPGWFLKPLIEGKIIREERKRYFLYRSTLAPFIQKILSLEEQQMIHERLTVKEVGLPEEEVWYHQTFSVDASTIQKASEKLGEHQLAAGEKEKALECFRRLCRDFRDVSLTRWTDWAIKAAEIFIWLDRFEEAVELLTDVEKAMAGEQNELPLKSRLVVWEKKGLALLHQQKLKEAGFYFSEGVRLASSNPATKVEEVRFLDDLAQIQMIMGQTDTAIQRFAEARHQFKDMNMADRQRVTNNDLGHVYYQIKDFEKAIPILQDDAKIFAGLPFKEPQVRAIYTLAECLRGSKRYDEAVKEYERCVAICKRENLLAILLRAYNGLGNVHLMHDRFPEALENYQKAIEISVHLKDSMTKAALLANQGLIYRVQKNWTQASRRFLLAKQILESKERRIPYESHLLSKCYSELAAIAKEENNTIKAISFQMERLRIVENSETLKPEEFAVKMEIVKLYLENRLKEPFETEITKLESMAKTEDEKDQVEALRRGWSAIADNVEQDSTAKVQKAAVSGS